MNSQLALGDFIFSVSDNNAYDSLSHNSDGGWVALPVIAGKPLSQNTGQGLDKITISGQVYGVVGRNQIGRLREMESMRRPYALIDGLGAVFGRYKIMSVSENQKKILGDGTAQVIKFTVSLEEFVG